MEPTSFLILNLIHLLEVNHFKMTDCIIIDIGKKLTLPNVAISIGESADYAHFLEGNAYCAIAIIEHQWNLENVTTLIERVSIYSAIVTNVPLSELHGYRGAKYPYLIVTKWKKIFAKCPQGKIFHIESWNESPFKNCKNYLHGKVFKIVINGLPPGLNFIIY